MNYNKNNNLYCNNKKNCTCCFANMAHGCLVA